MNKKYRFLNKLILLMLFVFGCGNKSVGKQNSQSRGSVQPKKPNKDKKRPANEVLDEMLGDFGKTRAVSKQISDRFEQDITKCVREGDKEKALELLAQLEIKLRDDENKKKIADQKLDEANALVAVIEEIQKQEAGYKVILEFIDKVEVANKDDNALVNLFIEDGKLEGLITKLKPITTITAENEVIAVKYNALLEKINSSIKLFNEFISQIELLNEFITFWNLKKGLYSHFINFETMQVTDKCNKDEDSYYIDNKIEFSNLLDRLENFNFDNIRGCLGGEFGIQKAFEEIKALNVQYLTEIGKEFLDVIKKNKSALFPDIEKQTSFFDAGSEFLTKKESFKLKIDSPEAESKNISVSAKEFFKELLKFCDFSEEIKSLLDMIILKAEKVKSALFAPEMLKKVSDDELTEIVKTKAEISVLLSSLIEKLEALQTEQSKAKVAAAEANKIAEDTKISYEQAKLEVDKL